MLAGRGNVVTLGSRKLVPVGNSHRKSGDRPFGESLVEGQRCPATVMEVRLVEL